MDLKSTYNRIADDWFNDHKQDDWWHEGTAKFVSSLPKGASVLDIGCGAGVKSKYLSDRGLKVIGMDFAEKLIEIAKRETPGVEFIVGDIYELDSYKKKFDAVFAQAVLLHIPKNRVVEVLEKFKNKLNPNGMLYIAVKEVKYGVPVENIRKENDYGYEYERFFSHFTLPEMKAYIERLGLKLVWENVKTSGRTNWIQVIAQNMERPPHEGSLEKFVKIARKYLKEKSIVIAEVGARDCTETLAFKHYFPDSKIIAFECNPDTLPVCRKKVARVEGVVLIEKAVTDSIGAIPFFKVKKTDSSYNSGISSIFQADKKYVTDFSTEEISVPTTTLEEEFKKLNLEKVDLMWMDIQGAELLALKGAGTFLEKIKIIQLEVEFYAVYKGQPLFGDIKKFLNSRGFKVLTFTTRGKIAADVVFVNSCFFKTYLPEWLVIAYFRLSEKIIGKVRVILNL